MPGSVFVRALRREERIERLRSDVAVKVGGGIGIVVRFWGCDDVALRRTRLSDHDEGFVVGGESLQEALNLLMDKSSSSN